MSTQGLSSSTAQLLQRLNSFKQTFLDEGHALRLNTGITSHLYHKCIRDAASEEESKQVSLDQVQIYTLDAEPDNPSFDSVFFDQLEVFLQENGFECHCSLGPQLQGRPGITVIQLELDPVERPTQ